MTSCYTMKKSDCKSCHKCIRHCPVKSIRFSGNQAHIMEEDCILCGSCYLVCPQNTQTISSEVEKVKVLLQCGDPVWISLAPSFITAFNGAGIDSMSEALQKLGFAGVEETALGATQVKKEYERILSDEHRDIVISSCCHSVNLLIQKYFPKELPYLADVITPMQAHCRDLKRRNPEAKCVFVGPCISKKQEAKLYEGVVDAVLTFEEIAAWMEQAGVVPEIRRDETEQSRARLFPTTGGILKTMEQNAPGFDYIAIDGVENCMRVLREIEEGKLHHCFIEMSACVGSCIGGPVLRKQRDAGGIKDYLEVLRYSGSEDFQIRQPDLLEMKHHFAMIDRHPPMPSDYEIMEILRQMGKFKPSHELNCGSCGYETCREKAIAIYQGKAEPSMCLPYLRDKAEGFSDTIVRNTPNGIIVLNDQLEVQQINRAAQKIMNIRSASDVLGDGVVRILDPSVFMRVRDSGRGVYDERIYLAEYKRHVEQTVVYDGELHLLICIMRDMTDEENERRMKESISRQTVEIADKVVDKQMRIVQEIASLLGETAAETKIALYKLKESIQHE